MGWKDKLKDRKEALGLNDQRVIPTKYIFEGDVGRCQKVKKFAETKLEQLSERIFSGSNPLKQGWQNSIKTGTGETINIFISFTFNIVQITAGGEISGKELRGWECRCNCNLTTGKVVSRILSHTPNTPYVNVGFPEARFYVYSVTICQREKVYILFNNIIGCDFTPWEVGQKVMLMAYKGFKFGCCYPDPITAFGETFAALYPATSCMGVREETTSIEDWSWRTPFRIITFCSTPIKFKYDKS